MMDVYIAIETRIPEDGERYERILGVFAKAEDARARLNQTVVEFMNENDLDTEGKTAYQDLQKLVNKQMEWRGPRWYISVHKLVE